jgi:hypothetical protein
MPILIIGALTFVLQSSEKSAGGKFSLWGRRKGSSLDKRGWRADGVLLLTVDP